MKTVIKAEIVAHSINEQGDELISVMATFPRFILAEVNTHRMLSKNTSSSRAIPFNKMVETIKEDPFIPIAWQKEHKGMQGTEYFTNDKHISLIQGNWLQARDNAIKIAEGLSGGIYESSEGVFPPIKVKEGVTKQLCNRLLEPFMWTTMLITGPKLGWDNFFNLRCPSYTFHTEESEKDFVFRSKKDVITKFGESEWVEDGFDKPLKSLTELDWLKVNYGQAEIHMMALAECIWDAYNESTPKKLKAGEWHIPFVDKMDFMKLGEASAGYYTDGGNLLTPSTSAVAVSVAMAARTSYTVVGEEKGLDYKALIGLHDRLLAQDPPHSSPLEHCARAMSNEEHNSYLKGKGEWWEHPFDSSLDKFVTNKGMQGWCNNFKGFIPYRYLVDNKISI